MYLYTTILKLLNTIDNTKKKTISYKYLGIVMLNHFIYRSSSSSSTEKSRPSKYRHSSNSESKYLFKI